MLWRLCISPTNLSKKECYFLGLIFFLFFDKINLLICKKEYPTVVYVVEMADFWSLFFVNTYKHFYKQKVFRKTNA